MYVKKQRLFVVSEDQTCQFVGDLDEAALDGPEVLDIEVSNFENNPYLVLLSIHRLLLQSRTPLLDVADIAEQIVNRVGEIVNGLWNMGSLRQKLFVSIEVELNYCCNEREYVEYLSAREYERRNHGMVPAKGSSIKALKTVVFEQEEGGNCTICFEDFWVGEKLSDECLSRNSTLKKRSIKSIP
ncbi:hypothetical protein RJ641_012572 [Dillenia turbinata]|uniref:Uncharacterized protein n=1 Tax=Dillenia turbinata TaxID=194707 RepID=A0AAN8Z466_9MAGN